MPATETGEMSGRTTFRTRPKSLKNPQQPLDPGRESLHEYIVNQNFSYTTDVVGNGIVDHEVGEIDVVTENYILNKTAADLYNHPERR